MIAMKLARMGGFELDTNSRVTGMSGFNAMIDIERVPFAIGKDLPLSMQS